MFERDVERDVEKKKGGREGKVRLSLFFFSFLFFSLLSFSFLFFPFLFSSYTCTPFLVTMNRSINQNIN